MNHRWIMLTRYYDFHFINRRSILHVLPYVQSKIYIFMISQDAGIKWQDVQCDTELWTLLKYMYTQVRCHDFCSFITEFTGSVIGLPCVEYIKKADFAILLYLLFWYCQLSWKMSVSYENYHLALSPLYVELTPNVTCYCMCLPRIK